MRTRGLAVGISKRRAAGALECGSAATALLEGSRGQPETQSQRNSTLLMGKAVASLPHSKALRATQFVLLFAVIALCASSALGAAPKPTLKSVGQKVYCLCGCVTTLEHCPHPPSECSMRAQMEALVMKDIDAGKDEAAILQDFVNRYGVQVLAAPPAKGFDLTAWILPGVGLILGLVVVIVIVRRMRKRSSEPAAATPAPVDPKVLAAVEEEMKRAGIRG
jgi:cytochrome c-type biogenesis protein CcmH